MKFILSFSLFTAALLLSACAQGITSSQPNPLLADYKVNVHAATTANVTISTALNNGDTLDGITLATGNRVLVKDQSSGAQNGIYVVGVTPVRASDSDTWAELPGAQVTVQAGTTNKGRIYVNTSAVTGTLGSTAVAYTAAGGGGGGSGDVSASANFATDNVLVRSDGTSKGVQATGIEVTDANLMLWSASGATVGLTVTGADATTVSALFDTADADGVPLQVGNMGAFKMGLSAKNLTATRLFYAPDSGGGGDLVVNTATQTLTNKRNTARVTTITSSGTPTVNTDSTDCVTITAQAAAITSMTSSLSGTPANFDQLEYRIKDDGTARAITWGSSFANGPVALPTTTITSKLLHVYFEWNSVTSKWECQASASDL